MNNKNIIAIIPARGGSKRIPKKNIIDFKGKPMIAHTIKAALESGLFDDVIVSTDDAEIAEISMDYGASIPFMRAENADDFSTVSDVIVYTLEVLKEKYNRVYDHVVLLLPNCPIRNKADILAAYNNFKTKDLNFQVSAFKFGFMNPWWAQTVKDGIPTPIFKDAVNNVRSQDLPETFCPTGAIWIAKTTALLESKTFYAEGHHFFPIDWKSAVDIDDYADLEMATIIYDLVNGKT